MTNLAIKPTKREVPTRLVKYGDGGVGKTTFAAGAPSPVFITSEDGLVNIDSMAVDPAPTCWEEMMAAIVFCRDKTDRKTVVVDSLDWLEPMCWDFTCRMAHTPKNKIQKIEDFGYGKGYLAALDNWRLFLKELSACREKGKHVILIAHAVSKLYKNPEGEDYDKWQMKLNVSAAGLIKEWADVVGFARVEVATYEVSPGMKNTRHKGLSSGKRVLSTNKSGAFDAKTRYAMPDAIDLNWSTFEKYVKGGDKEAVERLLQDFESCIATLGDLSVEANARNYLGARGASVPTLTEAIATLNSKIAAKQAAQGNGST